MDEAKDKLASLLYENVLVASDTLLLLAESEEMYRNLVNRINDGVVVLQDQLVKFANPRFVEMSGYSAETLINTLFTDYLTPDEIAVLYERYRRRMAGEYLPSIYEAAMTRRGGRKVPLEISAAIVSFHGRPADLVVVRDITERKKAEEYLQRYRLLSENARDIILFIGADCKIIEANQAAVEAYGYKHDELILMSMSELMIGDERENVCETIALALGFGCDAGGGCHCRFERRPGRSERSGGCALGRANSRAQEYKRLPRVSFRK